MEKQTLSKYDSSDLGILVSKDYIQSISSVKEKTSFTPRFIKNKILAGCLFGVSFVSICSIVILFQCFLISEFSPGGDGRLGNFFANNILLISLFFVGSLILGKLSEHEEQTTHELKFPQLVFIEQIEVKEGISLRIVDYKKEIVREQLFGIDDEKLLFETIVEWENELVELFENNSEVISEIKAELLEEYNKKKEIVSLQKVAVPLLENSNSNLQSTTK